MRAATVAKGSVAWRWHVAQEPDYMGSDHNCPTWQLHSLGAAYLALTLQMKSVLIFTRGRLVVPTSQACPERQKRHHMDSTDSCSGSWRTQNMWFLLKHFTCTTSTRSACSEAWAPHSTLLPHPTGYPWKGHYPLGQSGTK